MNEESPRCASCDGRVIKEGGGEYAGDVAAAGLCSTCATYYPPSLIKAVSDPFTYALHLRTGEVVRFESASFHGEWVHLVLSNFWSHENTLPFSFERGLDIRLSDIVWCADAPEGS